MYDRPQASCPAFFAVIATRLTVVNRVNLPSVCMPGERNDKAATLCMFLSCIVVISRALRAEAPRTCRTYIKTELGCRAVCIIHCINAKWMMTLRKEMRKYTIVAPRFLKIAVLLISMRRACALIS